MIAKYRLSQGWNPLPQKDQMAMVGVWLELLDADGVPPERYDDCYRAEMQRRAAMKADGRDVSPMTADDLCARWREIKSMHAELDKSRLLPENASASCLRCFGKGLEEMPDGSLRPGCEHKPLSDEERAERAARSATMLREAMRLTGRPKPVERPAPVPKLKGIELVCDSCGTKIDTLYHRYEDGDVCRVLLHTSTHDPLMPSFCKGIMRRTSPLKTTEVPAPSEAARVAFTITKAVRQQLYDLNYSRAQVDAMKPEEAMLILGPSVIGRS